MTLSADVFLRKLPPVMLAERRRKCQRNPPRKRFWLGGLSVSIPAEM